MKDIDYFYNEILYAKSKPRVDYGGNVLPAMEIYAAIEVSEEKKAYQDALEKLLKSDIEDVRQFGVDLCLGFFVFRDVLGKHS